MVSKRMQAAEPNPQRAAEVQKKTPWILEAVPSRHARVKVPEGIENTSHSATPEEFRQLFEQRRAALLKYVAETQDPMHDRVSPHMVFKDLDGCQWLLMISLHSERHAAQIAEVKAHPGVSEIAEEMDAIQSGNAQRFRHDLSGRCFEIAAKRTGHRAFVCVYPLLPAKDI